MFKRSLTVFIGVAFLLLAEAFASSTMASAAVSGFFHG